MNFDRRFPAGFATHLDIAVGARGEIGRRAEIGEGRLRVMGGSSAGGNADGDRDMVCSGNACGGRCWSGAAFPGRGGPALEDRLAARDG
jgi:hypothetical protein